MEPRSYVLAECTWKELDGATVNVAVLPWGATEAHNYHLPYATDNIESEAVAIEAARIATERGGKVMVLPTMPFGVNTGQLDIKLCVNMNPGTQAAVLADVVRSIEGSGIAKFVIVNGHGGNDFRQMIREIQPSTSVLLSAVNWYQIVAAESYFEEPGDHAGELETSVMMHVSPALVRPLSQAGSGRERKPRIAGFRERWAWMPRRWTEVTADTGVGNPRASTAAKGERYFLDVTEKLGAFLADLSAADPQDLYE